MVSGPTTLQLNRAVPTTGTTSSAHGTTISFSNSSFSTTYTAQNSTHHSMPTTAFATKDQETIFKTVNAVDNALDAGQNAIHWHHQLNALTKALTLNPVHCATQLQSVNGLFLKWLKKADPLAKAAVEAFEEATRTLTGTQMGFVVDALVSENSSYESSNAEPTSIKSGNIVNMKVRRPAADQKPLSQRVTQSVINDINVPSEDHLPVSAPALSEFALPPQYANAAKGELPDPFGIEKGNLHHLIKVR